MAWNMFRSHAPKEVIDMLQENITEAGVPSMSAEGQGGIFFFILVIICISLKFVSADNGSSI